MSTQGLPPRYYQAMAELCGQIEHQIASNVSQIAVSERPQEIEILTRRTEMLEAHAEYYSKVARSNFKLGLDGYNSNKEQAENASLNQRQSGAPLDT